MAFVRNALLNDWVVEEVDAEVEDTMWLKLDCTRMSSIIIINVGSLLPSEESAEEWML